MSDLVYRYSKVQMYIYSITDRSSELIRSYFCRWMTRFSQIFIINLSEIIYTVVFIQTNSIYFRIMHPLKQQIVPRITIWTKTAHIKSAIKEALNLRSGDQKLTGIDFPTVTKVFQSVPRYISIFQFVQHSNRQLNIVKLYWFFKYFVLARPIVRSKSQMNSKTRHISALTPSYLPVQNSREIQNTPLWIPTNYRLIPAPRRRPNLPSASAKKSPEIPSPRRGLLQYQIGRSALYIYYRYPQSQRARPRSARLFSPITSASASFSAPPGGEGYAAARAYRIFESPAKYARCYIRVHILEAMNQGAVSSTRPPVSLSLSFCRSGF